MNSILRMSRLLPGFILAAAILLSGSCAGSGPGSVGMENEVKFIVVTRVPTVGHRLYRFTSKDLDAKFVGPSFNLSDLIGIVQSPYNGMLYTYATDNDTIFFFNPDTGEINLAGTSGIDLPFATYGMDIDPLTNAWRVMSDIHNERFDVQSAIHQGSDALPEPPAGFSAIAYTPATGNPAVTTLYGIGGGGYELFRLGGVGGSPSPNGGPVTLIGELGLSNYMVPGLDIASNGIAYILAVRQGDDAIFLYKVNLATGAATEVGQIGGDPIGSEVIGFCIDARPSP